MKKNIYLTQFNNATERNLIPLAIGILSSFVKANSIINENFNVKLNILREDVDNLVKYYNDPYLVGFSNYFWNFTYTLFIAQKIKEKNPNTIIVFGGPSVPVVKDEVFSFFEEYPFVDVLVAGEGELVFNDILETLAKNESLETVHGISLNINGKYIYQEKREPINNFSNFPSPFLDGTFDEILQKYPNDITGVVWESNRGCPFSCTFCYWGGPEKRIIDYSDERVYAELDWISRNKINYIFGADANFGIRPRDLEIAKYIADLNIKTGFPKFFVINWNKNSTDKIFDIVDELNRSEVSFMLTVSVQSFYEPTLEAVKRKNIKMEHFHNILKEADKRTFNTYTEIILGLPLETYETFVVGLEKVLVSNINYHFNLYPCILITGTEMAGKEYIDKYKIETRRCEINLAKTKTIDKGFKEYEDIIVGTSTMDTSAWKASFIIGFLIKGFYGFRLTYFVFNFLRSQYKIDLINLFEYIIKYFGKENRILGECVSLLDQIATSILNNGKGTIKLRDIDTELYPEMAVLITILENKSDFYKELKLVLLEYLDGLKFEIDDKILDELLNYQRLIIPSYKILEDQYAIFSNGCVKEYFNLKKSNVKFVDHYYTDNIDSFLANHIYGGMIFKMNQIQ